MPATVEDYLVQVHRSMIGMNRAVRNDIVRELGANLAESVRANGGNVAVAVAAMGPPAQVARRYKEVYGYGLAYKVAFVVGAGVLGIFSLPVLIPNPEFSSVYLGPSIVLALLIGFLLWVSVEAGSRVGLSAGMGAAAARLLGFAVLYLSGQTFDRPGLVLLVAVSGLLVVLGWLPGRTKRAWKRPGAAL